MNNEPKIFGWAVNWANNPHSNGTGLIKANMYMAKELADARREQGAIVTTLYAEPPAAIQINDVAALQFAHDAMIALHEASEPDDTPELNPVVPAAVFSKFVDDMAQIGGMLHKAKQAYPDARRDLQKHLDRCASEVETWPEWKRACLKPAPIPDVVVDKHLDAVLQAAGSDLRYYTMDRTVARMRAAMREAMQAKGGAT